MVELEQLLCMSPSANLAALHGQMPMTAVALASGIDHDPRVRTASLGEDFYDVM